MRVQPHSCHDTHFYAPGGDVAASAILQFTTSTILSSFWARADVDFGQITFSFSSTHLTLFRSSAWEPVLFLVSGQQCFYTISSPLSSAGLRQGGPLYGFSLGVGRFLEWLGSYGTWFGVWILAGRRARCVMPAH